MLIYDEVEGIYSSKNGTEVILCPSQRPYQELPMGTSDYCVINYYILIIPYSGGMFLHCKMDVCPLVINKYFGCDASRPGKYAISS